MKFFKQVLFKEAAFPMPKENKMEIRIVLNRYLKKGENIPIEAIFTALKESLKKGNVRIIVEKEVEDDYKVRNSSDN